MAKINYIIGDATQPLVRKEEKSIIVHCCNALGAWGAGFVVPLGRRYPNARKAYIDYIKSGNVKLGDVIEVQVDENIYIDNLIGQFYVGRKPNGEPPIEYNAIYDGFITNIDRWKNKQMPFTIHMPRIGCGLAGGS